MNSDYLVGKFIGNNRYEIIEKIGSGGMATVYKAKCHVLNRFVAIKILKDSLKYDTEVVKKFNTESRAAARLSHPNIVQVYDVGESDGLDYIVMEYVDGITLKEYIQKKGRLLWTEACDFAAQIGRAIECAHTNGIIHRDIKPHNVLMAKDGMLKVADFGIAQATTSETLVAGNTGMGSVHYISPEQARGGFTNERSDIYSLGVVLYEMLSGEVPFDGANPVAIAIMKLEQEPKDCRIINPEIPDSAAKIAMKAISKEQHARYQSASQMVGELELVTGSVPKDIVGESEKFNTKRIDEEMTREEYAARRNEKSKKRKQKQRMKLLISGVLAVALVGLITYFAANGGRQEYLVPDLTNMTIEEAEATLKEADLRLNENIEYEVSGDIEEGKIIRQAPGVNQYVKKNRKITITVSSGLTDGQLVIVPDVENYTYEDAKKRLEEAGLVCKKEEEFSDTIELNYVIRQSPKNGSKVSSGFEVTVYVSVEGKASVPKLTGYTEDQARALLEQAGLSLGTVQLKESELPEGSIIEQNPLAGAEVEKGSKVDVFLSKTKEVTPSPTPDETMKKKILTITIPENSPEEVHIKAVANGKEIYNKTHKKEEGTVDIPVQASKDATVQVYIDNVLVADKIIQFE